MLAFAFSPVCVHAREAAYFPSISSSLLSSMRNTGRPIATAFAMTAGSPVRSSRLDSVLSRPLRLRRSRSSLANVYNIAKTDVSRISSAVVPRAKISGRLSDTARVCQWGGASGGCEICQLHCGEFAREVYHYVARIDSGSVATYTSVCTALGRPKAGRAVGNAMKVNVLNKPNARPRVPCHRVVRSDGSMAGYAGGGCSVKMDLLKNEGIVIGTDGKIPKQALNDYLSMKVTNGNFDHSAKNS